MLQVFVEGHAMEVRVPAAKLMEEEEDEKGEDAGEARRRSSSSNGNLVP